MSHSTSPTISIAVTGARGFVGSVLSDALSREGYSVTRLSSQQPGADSFFSLSGQVSPSILHGISTLIHAAYDFSLVRPYDIHRVNVEGTRRLFNAAIAAGVKKIIYISSMSAFAGTKQYYGRAKYSAEKMARGIGAYVVRPGIIYDDTNRGLIPKLAFFAKLPFVPLFDDGRQPVLLTHAQDLAELIVTLVRSQDRAPRAPITAAFPQSISFRALLAQLALRQKKSPRFIEVPSWLAFLLLRGMEGTGLRPPFRSDALMGLLVTNPAPDFSQTKAYGTHWRSFESDFS